MKKAECKVIENRTCRTCKGRNTCSVAQRNGLNGFCEYYEEDTICNTCRFETTCSAKEGVSDKCEAYEEFKDTCNNCVHNDKCLLAAMSCNSYFCEYHRTKYTRFELLKKWVETEDKQAIAEMLAIIAGPDSANDWDLFVPEFLEYLDEEVEYDFYSNSNEDVLKVKEAED